MTTQPSAPQASPTPPVDSTASGGLTSAEAAQRLRQDGPNALGSEGRRGPLAVLIGQFASPLVLILVAASAVSLVVGDRVEAGIILAIVVMSALLGFVQEARSEAAVAALQARLALRATVLRDGKQQEIPIHDVVRGDVVVLGAGDIVPADARLLDANHLFIDESSLTGESAAALKTPRPGELDPDKEDDRAGLAFFGTSVVSGTGTAVVTATGARTSYGTIAHRLAERAPETDFQHGVRAFSLLIGRVTLILVVGVFAINVARAAAALRRPALLHRLGCRSDARAAAGHRHPQPDPRRARPDRARRPGQAAAGDTEPGQRHRPLHRQDGHADAGQARAGEGRRHRQGRRRGGVPGPRAGVPEQPLRVELPEPARYRGAGERAQAGRPGKVPKACGAALRLQPADAQRGRPARQRAAAAGDQGRARSGRGGFEQRSRGPHGAGHPQGRARSPGEARQRLVRRRLPSRRRGLRGC